MALVLDAVGRARIAGAVRDVVAGVRFAATLDETRALLADGARALLVAEADADGRPTDALVREARARWPHVTVLAYCQPGRTPSDVIYALVQAGAHQLVQRGVDDERHALRAALRAGEQRCIADLLLAHVRPRVPPAVWPVVECFLRRAAEPTTVGEAARLLGVHRKTLVNRLDAAGCPPPMIVRTWCRLLVVARLLEEPARTVESIALQLDFPSATALRNQLRRHLGCTALELRARGGLAHALARFEAVLAEGHPGAVAPPPYARVAAPVAGPREAAAVLAGAATGAPARVAEGEPRGGRGPPLP